MIRNNILIAFRGFKKRKAFTVINILGLTLGMTVALLILTYARYELSYDRFHSNADDIYRVSLDIRNEGVFQVADAQCYPGVGPLAVEDFPEIDDYAMARHLGRLLFQQRDRAYNEDRVYFANPGWLRVFDWEVISGDSETALNEPDRVMLSETAAKKYFGDENPVGQTIDVIPGGGKTTMMVTGVFKDVPENAHLKFDILVSWESGVKYFDWKYDEWNNNNEFLYLLSNTSNLGQAFEDKFNEAFYTKTEYNSDDEILRIYPMTDVHLKSDRTYEAEVNGSLQMVNILFLVAFAVLVIAWVNYINLATAKSIERSKEVGVRKVLGSSRKSLTAQFFTEALIINMIALILTLTSIQGVLPVFNSIAETQLTFNVFEETNLLLQLLAMFVAGALASGLYPSIVLSNYKPLAVLTGKLKNSSGGLLLRKSLVVFQFAATMLLLVGTITVYNQVNYMRSEELGVDIDRTIVVKSPLVVGNSANREEKRTTLKNELLRNPRIASTTYSETVFGQGSSEMNTTTGVKAISTELGNGINFGFFTIDESFVTTFELNLLSGRAFDNDLETEFEESKGSYDAIMLNETSRKMLGFNSNEEAIGEKVKLGNQYTVVGVFEDYNHNSLKTSVSPMFFLFDKTGRRSNYLSIKVNGSSEGQSYKTVLGDIEKVYRQIYPGSDFDYYFLDEKFNEQYKADVQFGIVFTTFSGLSILISILGLFGLGLYEMQQRVKEIGIRKVLGASAGSIIKLMSGSFLKLIIISIVMALPLAYFGIDKWLDSYAYRIDIGFYLFLIPTLVLLSVALLTITLQSLKTANENPVKALRYE